MTGSAFLSLSATVALGLYALALLLVAVRLLSGPTLADRVLAIDLLVAIGIGFIAAFTLASGYFAYLDIAIGLGLVGFLSTLAFARFITVHAAEPGEPDA